MKQPQFSRCLRTPVRTSSVVICLVLGFASWVASCSSDSASSKDIDIDAGTDASLEGGTGGNGPHDATTDSNGTGGIIIPTDSSTDGLNECDGTDCPGGFKCRFDVCVPDLGTCNTHDDCPGDSYCSAEKECLPYGVPPSVINDPDCKRTVSPDGVKPAVQCEWNGPEAGDPTEKYAQVYTAPMVADFNLDNDPDKLQPSIVISTFYSGANGNRIGMLRVFDGRTCTEQFNVGGPSDLDNRAAYGTQWAIADLDGDVPTGGRPEIIGLRAKGDTNKVPINLYAIKVDVVNGKPQGTRKWIGRRCSEPGEPPVEILANTANFGPGVWDLDGDGKPEIVLEQMVFDADGCVLNDTPPVSYLEHGMMVAVADVDLDGKPELVMHDKVAGWDATAKKWVTKSWFKPNSEQKPGHIAIVDLGNYSELPGKPIPNKLPEVIVVSAESNAFNPNSTGTIRVQTLDGTIVWGPVELHHDSGVPGGHGGPPTASDFDGDGWPEFAAAANQYYAVYDPDCVEALNGKSPPQRPGGKCNRSEQMKHLPDGVLWAQESQDFSSSGTGSSIFDFNGDGQAEAVYRDECYLRVYEGPTGTVMFSAPASSGTGFDMPTIVDVDGDFATEIVVPRSVYDKCPAHDPLFSGGAAFEAKGGFVVLRDPKDRWAASRPIWNQHAYHITNVTDNATIPKSSEIKTNWTEKGLNNFRQNTQGDLGVLHIADLTVVLSDITGLCAGYAGTKQLDAKVCNRGTNPVQDGVQVQFVEVPSEDTKVVVCETTTSKLLKPGDCESVNCTGNLTGTALVKVIVDPTGSIADCHSNNNEGASTLELCPK